MEMARGSAWRLVFVGAAIVTLVSGLVGLVQHEWLDAFRGFGFAAFFAYFTRLRR